MNCNPVSRKHFNRTKSELMMKLAEGAEFRFRCSEYVSGVGEEVDEVSVSLRETTNVDSQFLYSFSLVFWELESRP